MVREFAEAMRLDLPEPVSFEELVERSGLPAAVVRELVEYGALEPIDPAAPTWQFATRVVLVARTARRLHRDFELDPHALALVLRFVERVEALETELRALRARRGG